jgi:hypothetical protein
MMNISRYIRVSIKSDHPMIVPDYDHFITASMCVRGAKRAHEIRAHKPKGHLNSKAETSPEPAQQSKY